MGDAFDGANGSMHSGDGSSLGDEWTETIDRTCTYTVTKTGTGYED